MEEKLAKYFAGEATEEERKEVEQWRSEKENLQHYLDAKEAWSLTGPIAEPTKEISYAIVQEREVKVVGWPVYLKYAAAAVLLALIGALWYFDTGSENSQTAKNEVFSGTVKELKDGTLVSLKKGSTIHVLSMNKTERLVEVQGKAYFDVARDESRPFKVLTRRATAEVLGTSFLVDNEKPDRTEVCVEHGRVAFSKNDARNQKLTVRLDSGDMGIVGKGIRGVVKRKNSNKNFLAWKDGVLTFERTPIQEVFRTIEDVYGLPIEYTPNLINCRLTAKYEKKSLAEVIQFVCDTFAWTYDLQKEKVVLSGDGC